MGKLIDLTGERFGKWTVLGRDDSVTKKNIYWKCQCACGTVRSVAGTSLRGGISVSCGCEKDEKTSQRTKRLTEDLAGQRFGEWTVLYQDFSENNRTAKRGARWICRCSCGKQKSVLGYSLKAGRSLSCGHTQRDIKREDLTGQTFGHLKVIEFAGYETSEGGYSRTKWRCKCSCRKTIEVLSKKLKSGEMISCGCIKKKSERDMIIIGETYDYWTILEEDYSKKGKGKYYICRCKCGNIRSISASNLKRRTSRSCGCARSNYNDLVGQTFGELTVIEKDQDKYGEGVHWKCRCSCGNIKSFRTVALKKGKVISCGCISRKIASERMFNDLEGKRFGRLLAICVDHKDIDNQGNTAYYWDCLCDCGNHIVVLGSTLTRGDTKSCGCLQAEASALRAKSRIIDITGKRFGALTVFRRVEENDENTGFGFWECKCDCGNTKLAEGYYLRKGMITSCGCLKQSKYELYVSQYFDEIGLISPDDFESQKRFDDLRADNKLSYDFAVYKQQELYLLIECQGQQHYEPIEWFGGVEQFEKQQEHDRIKREYAKGIGVPLLEIPYTADTYESIKDILSVYIPEGFGG